MPIYEYECGTCGRLFEKIFTSVFARDDAEPNIRCPECNGKVARIISAPLPERTKWPLKKRKLPPELRRYNQ